MAKRNGALGGNKSKSPRKTKKRLALKLQRLTELMRKNRRHNRPVAAVASLNLKHNNVK